MKNGLFPAACLLVAVLSVSQTEVEITTDPTHHLALQNDDVRVFKVEVAPSASTLMHWHRHDYVYVVLGQTEISNQVEGKPAATLKLLDGAVKFSNGGFAHAVRDLANTPFRNVTIEFMQDKQMQNAPPKWDEERGLHILEGGTQDIMFVKDGARVSEIELQPGGKVPKHHHAGPHLVIAVTDVDLRSDIEGKGPTTVHLTAGDIKWVEGGFTHSVTNTGKQGAKLVTVEFPGSR